MQLLATQFDLPADELGDLRSWIENHLVDSESYEDRKRLNVLLTSLIRVLRPARDRAKEAIELIEHPEAEAAVYGVLLETAETDEERGRVKSLNPVLAQFIETFDQLDLARGERDPRRYTAAERRVAQAVYDFWVDHKGLENAAIHFKEFDGAEDGVDKGDPISPLAQFAVAFLSKTAALEVWQVQSLLEKRIRRARKHR